MCKFQQELIIYVSQTRTDVALAPQYHLSRDDWQRMRLRLKVIKMLPSSQYCSDSVHNEGTKLLFCMKIMQLLSAHSLL